MNSIASLFAKTLPLPIGNYARHPELPLTEPMGMTLRDYFAGQALAGNISGECNEKLEAGWAYMIADAMMKEREEKAE